MSYDVFFSYNSQDRAAVEEIARKLFERGIRCFLDLWYLPRGQPWRSLLEQTLADTRAVAVFVGPQGMGPWQHREVDVALDFQARNNRFPVIPVLLPGCEPPLGFLRQNAWIDLRNQPLDQVVLLLEKSIRGEAPGPDLQAEFAASKSAVCPYRGLLYFREEDSPFFFGRDAAINELSKAVARTPLVAVVGASGSGKSSVARAGLVPRLRKERDTVWEISALVPGDEPLKSLAASIVPLLFPEIDPIDRREKANKLATKFAEDSINLRDIVRDVLDRQTGTQRLLLIGDQWEELYTLTKDESQRRRFVDELLDATSRSPLSVVPTLRGDFVGKALAYRPLSDRLQDAQVNLGPMTAKELEQAVRRPASEVGLEFETGLDRRILGDVGDEPGNLPLLEFVLRELWDNRQRGQLLHDSYDRMGGLQGAVAAKAEALFEKLSPPEQEATRRLFLQLVHTAEEGKDTCRRVAIDDVASTEAGRVVLKKLADARLVTTSGEPEAAQAELAHEALISGWRRLGNWVNENRERSRLEERLFDSAREWQKNGKGRDFLYRGAQLAAAEKSFGSSMQFLPQFAREFLEASVAERNRELKKRLRRLARLTVQWGAIIMFIAAWVQLFDLSGLDTSIASFTMQLGSLFRRPQLDDRIAIVAKDTAWSRGHEAQLINALSRAGAKSIAFDMYLNEPRPDDDKLIAAIQSAKALGTAVIFGTERGSSAVASIEKAASGIGLLCTGGKGWPWPTLSSPLAVIGKRKLAAHLSVLAAYPGGQIEEIDQKNWQIRLRTPTCDQIKFSTIEKVSKPEGDCPILEKDDTVAQLIVELTPLEQLRDPTRRYRFEDIFQETVAGDRFTGKIVLVGQEKKEDMKTVFREFRSEGRYGFEIHADMLNALLQGTRIRPLGLWEQFAVMLAMGILGVAPLFYRPLASPVWRRCCYFGAVFAAYVAFAIWLYVKDGILLNMLYHLGTMFITYWALGKAARRLGVWDMDYTNGARSSARGSALRHLILLALILAQAGCASTTTVKEVQGSAVVIQQGRAITARSDLALKAGDELQTEPGSAVILHFPGSDEVYVLPQTRVRIESIRDLIGDIFVRAKGLFAVKTEFATAGVEGTEFFVSVDAKNTVSVGVFKGRVILESRTGL